jgi:hypothetical protein
MIYILLLLPIFISAMDQHTIAVKKGHDDITINIADTSGNAVTNAIESKPTTSNLEVKKTDAEIIINIDDNGSSPTQNNNQPKTKFQSCIDIFKNNKGIVITSLAGTISTATVALIVHFTKAS